MARSSSLSADVSIGGVAVIRNSLWALWLMFAVACASAPVKKAEAPKPAGPAAPPVKLVELPPAVMYKEARELMARGDLDGARAKLDAYLGREPKSAAGLFDAGWIAEKQGDTKAAPDYYARALKQEPAHLGAALNLSRLLKAQEKPAEAEKVIRGALEKRDDDPQLLNALASILRLEKKLDEADAAARKVLLRHPKDAEAYRNMAAIEADRGHVRLAESALQNARKLDDKDAGIFNSLGLLAMKRDDVQAARGYFEQATQLDPQNAAAWANLGAIALSYRDYESAEQDYARAVQLDGSRWDTHLAHGWALEGQKKPKDARAEYEKVLAMKPSQEDALYGKALALKAENDLPGAMAAFKAYVSGGKAAHAKEAEGQIAAIDLRLKNPPAALKPAAPPEKRAVAAGAGAGAGSGEFDLSKLPQGTDTGGPSAEKLPSEAPSEAAPLPAIPAAPAAAPAPKKDDPAPKPAAGKDGGVQNAKQASTVQAAVSR